MKIEKHEIDDTTTIELSPHADLMTAQVIDGQAELFFYVPDSKDTVMREFVFLPKDQEHLELDSALQHRITINGPKSFRFHIFERV